MSDSVTILGTAFEAVEAGPQRKADLTLDKLVHAAQSAWTRFRDAQLYTFFHVAPLLTWARENEAAFLSYCKRNSVTGEADETRVVELMLAADPDSDDTERKPSISRERRAEYAACIGWFADKTLCPETDPDKAVEFARQKGRITGIAREYREKKDAQMPAVQVAKQKAQATKAKNKSGAASAARARAIIDRGLPAEAAALSKPEFLQRRPACEANGDAATMIEFLDNHGVQAGIRRDLDDAGDDEIYIYLRVLNRLGKFIWYGAAANDDLANQIADLLVAASRTRNAKEAA